jgi:cyanophycinase
MAETKGRLIIIGGHEDREGDKEILKEVCRDAMDGQGKLVLLTVATQEPEEVAKEYIAAFSELGISQIEVLDIRNRQEGYDETLVQKLEGASVLFFTGGDQLRIASQVGDTLLFQTIQRLYREGCTVAGTSAGAAVMPETMLVGGENDESHHAFGLHMAAGLAFIHNVAIDTHFAERGRIGRLIGTVTENPRNLGIGLDEDTAIIVEQEKHFRVIGSGGVYVLDGTGITHTSLSEDNQEGIMSVFGLKLHVLRSGDCFELETRVPIPVQN